MWVEKQLDTGTVVFDAMGGNSEFSEFAWKFDVNAANTYNGLVDAAIGRGVTNTAVTYLRLVNAVGQTVFAYLNSSNAWVLQTTQP